MKSTRNAKNENEEKCLRQLHMTAGRAVCPAVTLGRPGTDWDSFASVHICVASCALRQFSTFLEAPLCSCRDLIPERRNNASTRDDQDSVWASRNTLRAMPPDPRPERACNAAHA